MRLCIEFFPVSKRLGAAAGAKHEGGPPGDGFRGAHVDVIGNVEWGPRGVEDGIPRVEVVARHVPFVFDVERANNDIGMNFGSAHWVEPFPDKHAALFAFDDVMHPVDEVVVELGAVLKLLAFHGAEAGGALGVVIVDFVGTQVPVVTGDHVHNFGEKFFQGLIGLWVADAEFTGGSVVRCCRACERWDAADQSGGVSWDVNFWDDLDVVLFGGIDELFDLSPGVVSVLGGQGGEGGAG